MKFSCFLVLGLTVWGPCFVRAEDKFVHCAKYLMVAGDLHKIPALSRRHSEEALQSLRKFRDEWLNPFDLTPSDQAVTASYRSSYGKNTKVAQRISGVLDRAPETLGEASGTQKAVLASLFKGRDEVVEVLKARNQFVLQPKGLETHLVKGGAASIDMLVGVLLTGLTQALLTNSMPIQFGCLVLSYFLANNTEEFLRDLDFYSTRRLPEEWRLLYYRLKKLQPGQWVYYSFNQRFPRSVIEWILAGGEITSDQLREVLINHRSSRVMAKWIPTSLSFIPSDQPASDEVWLQIDELFRINEAGNPELVTVVRWARQLLRSPKRSWPTVHDFKTWLIPEPT